MAARHVRRVLMTADAMGGVWTYTRELTSFLHSQDVRVLVAVMGAAPKEKLPVPLVHKPLSLEWQDRAGDESYSAASHWLKHLADDFKPDVIHLNGYVQASAGWDVPVIAVAHSCVYSWWRAVHGCTPPEEWDLYRARVRKGLMNADAVVAPTLAMLRNLHLDYGFATERGQVICNATGLTRSSGEREELIVASGRSWDKAKNLSMLEASAAQLRWPLRVAGGDLSFSEMTGLFGRARIFAHPALYEPFGLGVLEAARSGCALVLADIPTLRELWNGAAVFIDPRDPGRWVEVLNNLSQDAAAVHSLAEQAHSRSLQFTPERFGNAYLALYESAVRGAKESLACA